MKERLLRSSTHRAATSGAVTAASVHESETRRPILRFSNLVQAPIAKDSGRSSFVIRFRMLHAISASASCDLCRLSHRSR